MPKHKTLNKNVAAFAILLIVAVLAIGDFTGLYQISTYGGTTQYYLADSTHSADTVILTGSRGVSEVLAPCTSSAEHRIRVVQTTTGDNYNEITTQRHSIGVITYNSATNRYLFGDGSSATAFKFSFVPTMSGDYIAFESIQCAGSAITSTQQLNFRVSARPTSTPTIVKNCNLGANDKTRDCYYRTCEVQANGNWDYGAEKQSPTFCPYVPPVVTPTTPTTPVVQPSCTPNWVTSEWSPCIASKQTRSVTDNNNCANPSTSKPDVEKACTMPVVTPPTDNGAGSGTGTGSNLDDFLNTYKWYVVGGIVLVFAWLSGLIYYLSGKKR